MDGPIARPTDVQINAWTEKGSPKEPLPPQTPWAFFERALEKPKWLAPPPPVDKRRWEHPEVGWGLILVDDDDVSKSDRAKGADAPPAIQKLLQSRPDSPVLRYRPELQQAHLRRYYADGRSENLSVNAPTRGTGEGKVPKYLLIYGSPKKIPWALQYALNMSAFVGRLDLEGVALDNYINALITDWVDQKCDPTAPVVWSVNHGPTDITNLMEQVVADKVWALYQSDDGLSRRLRLSGKTGTAAALGNALAEHKPGLIISTSHGMTGQLYMKEILDTQLGSPVDMDHVTVDLTALKDWQPSGAIWYSHGCCSAGSDNPSRFKDLLQKGGQVDTMLNSVAAFAGARVAPLANALLGAAKPLRAFVGHVEPTFDWTLRDPSTNEVTTTTLQRALYNWIYQADMRTPIGFALEEVYDEAGAFYGAWQDAINKFNDNVSGAWVDWALYRQLSALDRQTLVILGDPTVSLPRVTGP